MTTKDNIYVNAADICLSMVDWSGSNCSVEVRAEIDHPARTLYLDEYTKKVQDEVFDTIKAILYADDGCGIPYSKAHEIFYDLDGDISIHTIFHNYTGSLFMERYKEYQKKEEKRKKAAEQAKIALTIEFLDSKGYTVYPPHSKEDES